MLGSNSKQPLLCCARLKSGVIDKIRAHASRENGVVKDARNVQYAFGYYRTRREDMPGSFVTLYPIAIGFHAPWEVK